MSQCCWIRLDGRQHQFGPAHFTFTATVFNRDALDFYYYGLFALLAGQITHKVPNITTLEFLDELVTRGCVRCLLRKKMEEKGSV